MAVWYTTLKFITNFNYLNLKKVKDGFKKGVEDELKVPMFYSFIKKILIQRYLMRV